MIEKITAASTATHPVPLNSVPPSDAGPSYIHMILLNKAEIACGHTRTLHLIEPALLKPEQLNALDKKALLVAKIILHEKTPQIRGAKELCDLDFDDIAYTVQQNGQQVQGNVQRQNAQIDTLDEQEAKDLENEIALALAKASETKTETALPETEDPNEALGATFRISTTDSKYIALLLSMLALKSQQQNGETRHKEQRRDERAMLERDQRKRNEKKREEDWQQRQAYFLKKEQNQRATLKDDLRFRLKLAAS